MKQAILEKGLFIETPAKVGVAGQLTDLISAKGHVDIKSLWAGELNGKGTFSVITEKNDKVVDVLKGSPFSSFKEEDVLVIPVKNEVGAFNNVVKRLGDAGINIKWIYTSLYGKEPVIILSTDNDVAALKLFKH